MLIFSLQMANFLARATKSRSRKINPEVHSLKFASFLSPRTQQEPQELSCPAPAQPRIANLSATVPKHAKKFNSQFKMGFTPKQNTEILKVWKHFVYQAFRPCYRMQNGPQLKTPPFFSSKVIPDFPAGSSCPPEKCFGHKVLIRFISLRGARDLRISGLHDVLPSPGRP